MIISSLLAARRAVDLIGFRIRQASAANIGQVAGKAMDGRWVRNLV
jgi:hypothetical protein